MCFKDGSAPTQVCGRADVLGEDGQTGKSKMAAKLHIIKADCIPQPRSFKIAVHICSSTFAFRFPFRKVKLEQRPAERHYG